MDAEPVRRRNVAMAATLGLAAAAWVVSVARMDGMHMGVATPRGPFAPFVATWVVMMAAMMLPGAVPAVARHARTDGRRRAVPVFLASYLAVWALVGIAVYAVYRPHGTLTAGVAAIVAGAYELTPLKRHFRRCGRPGVRSGFEYGRYCVGSSIALMLLLVAVGVMSVGWMAAIAALLVTQKLRAPGPAVDVPVALALVAVGVLVVVAPVAVPGLTPSM